MAVVYYLWLVVSTHYRTHTDQWIVGALVAGGSILIGMVTGFP